MLPSQPVFTLADCEVVPQAGMSRGNYNNSLESQTVVSSRIASKDVSDAVANPDWPPGKRNDATSASRVAVLHCVQKGRRWDVEFEGAIVVPRSTDPELDLARALLARGITGSVAILDGKTGKPRILIRDIAKAAELCIEEGPNGPRFVRRRQTRVDRAPAADRAPSGSATQRGAEPPLLAFINEAHKRAAGRTEELSSAAD